MKKARQVIKKTRPKSWVKARNGHEIGLPASTAPGPAKDKKPSENPTAAEPALTALLLFLFAT